MYSTVKSTLIFICVLYCVPMYVAGTCAIFSIISKNVFYDNRTNVHANFRKKKCNSIFNWTVAAGPPWGSARELSLSPLTRRGDPPPPLLAPGRVASPRHIIGV
jgi:hypothetical protein